MLLVWSLTKKEKLSLGGAATFPTLSVIYPDLQATVTKDYLAYSAVDIFAYCLRYVFIVYLFT